MKEFGKYYPSSKYYSYSNSNKKDFFGTIRAYLVRSYYKENFFFRLFSFFVISVPAIPSAPIGKILDVGCGTGETLSLLKEVGWNVYGLDLDKDAINIAKKRGITAKIGSYEEIESFPKDYFDAIRLYHVIEHIGDPSVALKLIYLRLKPGGQLILGAPNYNSIVRKIFGSFWYNLDAPRHLFLFSPKNLIALGKKNGFIDPHVDYFAAGGILGSIQYIINEKFNKKVDLLSNIFLVLLFFIPELLTNKLSAGDIFTLRMYKKKYRV
ncbi:MAG: class I SAM-dependent methyltransferase [Candidatus Levyibacteriota bacterium]